MSNESRSLPRPTQSTHALRERVLSDPDVILDDTEVMRALVGANEARMGGNVVDLRGAAMARLEERLDQLEDTHRSVVAAAYDNVAGTEQIHRAVLRLLEPASFEEFLLGLQGEVAGILCVDSVKLVLESQPNAGAGQIGPGTLERFGDVLAIMPPGGVAAYLGLDPSQPPRAVTLRVAGPLTAQVFGTTVGPLGSEALIRLDLGAQAAPALLALATRDAQQFRAGQGTDLLAFLGDVFERALVRWLA